MIYVWLILLVLMIIAELATLTALVTIWFIPPAIISLILAYLNVSTWIQIAVFLILSLFNLTQTKKIVKFLERKPKFYSNSDSLINKEATLITAINKTSQGTLKINDVIWNVKTIDDTELEEGTVVKIQAIKGNTLIVEKKGEDLIKV